MTLDIDKYLILLLFVIIRCVLGQRNAYLALY